MPGTTIINLPFVHERRRRITEKASLSEQTDRLIWYQFCQRRTFDNLGRRGKILLVTLSPPMEDADC
ncbi:hypothetical protein GRJ2_002348000 [Grus japonensis]|uniref:Ycf15 n=1 Tax=Grus japonensis TaxID=30415 RepID=A0ABC9XN10_GRUJA